MNKIMTVKSFWTATGSRTLADETVIEIPSDMPPEYFGEACVEHLQNIRRSAVEVRSSEIELRITFKDKEE